MKELFELVKSECINIGKAIVDLMNYENQMSMKILFKRIKSLIIDYILFSIVSGFFMFGIYAIIMFIRGFSNLSDPMNVHMETNTFNNFISTTFFLFMFLLFYWRERHDVSLGRSLMKLKLINQNSNDRPSRLNCLVRVLMLFFLPVDIVVAVLNKDHMTLTDMITKTQVVSEEEAILR